jgi:hypothetical protein
MSAWEEITRKLTSIKSEEEEVKLETVRGEKLFKNILKIFIF